MSVDASLVDALDYFAVGIVGRDHGGNVIFAICNYLHGNFFPNFAELQVVKEVVSLSF